MPKADCLIKLPLNDTHSEVVPIPCEMVLFFEQLDTTPATSSIIVLMTKRDHTLSKVLEMTKLGICPLKSKDIERETELSTQYDVLLWNNIINTPSAGKQTLLNELHRTHYVIVKMKSLERSVVWWSGMDSEIESCVQSCHTCQSSRHQPMKAPFHHWVFSDGH